MHCVVHVLFVCKCVLYYCHRVSIQLQLNMSYHIISYHITKNGNKKGAVHQLCIDSNKAYYGSVCRDVLCNFLSAFGIPVKLVRLKNVLKWNLQQSADRQAFVWHISYSECFETKRRFIAIAARLCFTDAVRRVQANQRCWIKWYT